MNELQKHDLGYLTDCEHVVGVDEAGRGALAGPVMAGACAISREFFECNDAVKASLGVNDSKKLSAADREDCLLAMKRFQETGLVGIAVGVASVQEIADHNILGATRLAMSRAVEKLALQVSGLVLPEVSARDSLFWTESSVKMIVDGRPLKPFPYAHEGIVKGDSQSLCIAMAGIAAKVARDREMIQIARSDPDYGFEMHKGYGTKTHREAIIKHGPSAVHRGLFLRKILGSDASIEAV